MAAIGFPEHAKSVKLPSGVTYSYVHVPPTSDAKPTILFLHGFPSSSWDWRHQIRHFSSLGYGVLAPDLLGYGGTDKPASPDDYALKRVAGHVAEILDRELLSQVHGVAHDFGSAALSRLVVYYPDKLLSCSFLSVPYVVPGNRFDLDELKPITEEALGFEKYGYMRFLNREDSWQVLEKHAESGESLIYAEDSWWVKHVYPPGVLENFMVHDRMAPPSNYVTPDEMETRRRIFAAGGYRGPTNWYRVTVRGIGIDEEARDNRDPNVNCPVLVITEADGPGNLPFYAEMARRYAADYRSVKVSTQGHWIQLESRDETNSILAKFFDEAESGANSKL